MSRWHGELYLLEWFIMKVVWCVREILHEKDSPSPWRFDVLILAIHSKLLQNTSWMPVQIIITCILSLRLLSFVFSSYFRVSELVMSIFLMGNTGEVQKECPTDRWWVGLVLNIFPWGKAYAQQACDVPSLWSTYLGEARHMPNKSKVFETSDEPGQWWELGPLGTWPYKYPRGVTHISSPRLIKQEFLGIQFTKIKALRIKTQSHS